MFSSRIMYNKSIELDVKERDDMTKMKISYKKLRYLMIDRNVEFFEIRKVTGIGSSTITKIKRDQEVALDVLLRICGYFNCNIGDICEAVPVKEKTDEQ